MSRDCSLASDLVKALLCPCGRAAASRQHARGRAGGHNARQPFATSYELRATSYAVSRRKIFNFSSRFIAREVCIASQCSKLRSYPVGRKCNATRNATGPGWAALSKLSTGHVITLKQFSPITSSPQGYIFTVRHAGWLGISVKKIRPNLSSNIQNTQMQGFLKIPWRVI